MNIESISISGFANLKEVTLNGNLSAALVAPNSYGKSNVLSAISFGLKFIKASEEEKQTMMSDTLFSGVKKSAFLMVAILFYNRISMQRYAIP